MVSTSKCDKQGLALGRHQVVMTHQECTVKKKNGFSCLLFGRKAVTLQAYGDDNLFGATW